MGLTSQSFVQQCDETKLDSLVDPPHPPRGRPSALDRGGAGGPFAPPRRRRDGRDHVGDAAALRHERRRAQEEEEEGDAGGAGEESGEEEEEDGSHFDARFRRELGSLSSIH